jgi:hypothetical protein
MTLSLYKPIAVTQGARVARLEGRRIESYFTGATATAMVQTS